MKKSFLALSLFFCSSYVFANPVGHVTPGGWDVKSVARDGITSTYTATKESLVNGKKVVQTSVARLTPSISAVLRYGTKGPFGIAIGLITLLPGVDYLVTPNAIEYRPLLPQETSGCSQYSCDYSEYLYFYGSSSFPSLGSAIGYACKRWGDYYAPISITVTSCSQQGDGGAYKFFISNIFGEQLGSTSGSVQISNNPNYSDTAPTPPVPDRISVPQPQVADLINQSIDDAISPLSNQLTDLYHNTADASIIDGANSVGVPASAVDQLFTEGAVINPAASDAGVGTGVGTGSSTTTGEVVSGEGAGTGTGTGTSALDTATESAFELPAFCSWVPIVCQASSTIISFPARLFDIFRDESDLYDRMGTQKASPIVDNEERRVASGFADVANRLTFTNSACPSDIDLNIPNIGSYTIPVSNLCSLMAVFKLFFHLAVLFACAKMITASVREL